MCAFGALTLGAVQLLPTSTRSCLYSFVPLNLLSLILDL